MRFRSYGTSASNLEEFLSKVKETEEILIKETTTAHFNFLSLDENKINNEEYDMLGHKGSYKMKKYRHRKRRKNRKKSLKSPYFRTKFYFHKRYRVYSQCIDEIKSLGTNN